MRCDSLIPLILLAGCDLFAEDEDPAFDQYEGNYADECTNGVDEDEDGLFDCDDETCEGSPDCEEEEISHDSA